MPHAHAIVCCKNENGVLPSPLRLEIVHNLTDIAVHGRHSSIISLKPIPALLLGIAMFPFMGRHVRCLGERAVLVQIVKFRRMLGALPWRMGRSVVDA